MYIERGQLGRERQRETGDTYYCILVPRNIYLIVIMYEIMYMVEPMGSG